MPRKTVRPGGAGRGAAGAFNEAAARCRGKPARVTRTPARAPMLQ